MRKGVTLGPAALVAAALTAGIAGAAAPTAPPVVRGLPSIAGAAEEGRVLTARRGDWGGARPISYTYRWRSCGAAGGDCQDIPNAENRTFTLAGNDVGKRLRVRVTARNRDGAASAISRPTAVVRPRGTPPPPPPPPPGPPGQIRLADGRTSIPVTSVPPSQRLIVSGVVFSPTVIRSRAPFTATFRITDTRGYVVREALVYMTGIPFGRIVQPSEQATSTEGQVTFQVQPTARLPLVNGNALVVFVRARKAGDNLLAGISSRRLVQVRLGAP